MVRTLPLLALFAPGLAFACPGAGSDEMALFHGEQATVAATADLDPTACARSASLVGAGCTWSTRAMAQRVNTEGRSAGVTAKLTSTADVLSSEVAAPYRAGDLYVIANQVIEQATIGAVLSMSGKVLEVDGVKYFLVTAIQNANS
jgi:hypothetical protein